MVGISGRDKQYTIFEISRHSRAEEIALSVED